MAKTSMQDMANEISDKHGLSKHDAETFVSAFFDLINDGLRQDKMVKIKGLGTFKVVDVKDRESVNINTGERVIIEGHGKITFVPDSIMRDLVNKPFAPFETVVLNEGVDIDQLNSVQMSDFTDENISVDEETIDEGEVTDTSVDNAEEEVSTLSSIATVSSGKITGEENKTETSSIETIKPDVKPEIEISKEEKAAVLPVADEEDIHLENDDKKMGEKKEPTRFRLNLWLFMFGLLFIGGVALIAGYYWGHNADKTVSETVRLSVPKNQAKLNNQLVKPVKKSDTENIKPKDSVIKPDPADEIETVSVKAVVEEAQDKEQSIYEKKILKKAEAQVRTGAYRIIGTSQTVSVRKGETMKRLSKFYLGDGMECYVQVHNGIAEIKEGMKVNIPKLKLKKK